MKFKQIISMFLVVILSSSLCVGSLANQANIIGNTPNGTAVTYEKAVQIQEMLEKAQEDAYVIVSESHYDTVVAETLSDVLTEQQEEPALKSVYKQTFNVAVCFSMDKYKS